VATTRKALFDLASACDYESLASLAREHGTTVSVWGFEGLAVGDDEVHLGSEDDLVRAWIADGRSPSEEGGIRSSEPLAALAAMLGTTPLHIDNATDLPAGHPRTEGALWVWPAIYMQRDGHPQDRDIWAEHRDYRIAIAPDGTWLFFMAGDFE
jgi:hypothetical protein